MMLFLIELSILKLSHAMQKCVSYLKIFFNYLIKIKYSRKSLNVTISLFRIIE